MKSKRPISERDSGATLVLAVGFVLAIGAISGGLAAFATSSLNSRAALKQVRDREYAADGVMEKAIAQARGFDCNTVTTPIRETFDLVPIWVDVTNSCGGTIPSSDGFPYSQRNVIFSACLDESAVCTAAKTIIRAQVNFEPSSGPVIKTYIQSWNVNK